MVKHMDPSHVQDLLIGLALSLMFRIEASRVSTFLCAPLKANKQALAAAPRRISRNETRPLCVAHVCVAEALHVHGCLTQVGSGQPNLRQVTPLLFVLFFSAT